MQNKSPKRECPRCFGAVYVIKSITPSKHHTHVERLQKLKCSHCGLTGTLTIKEDIVWSYPDLA